MGIGSGGGNEARSVRLLARGMLDRQDCNFVCGRVNRIIDKISILAGDVLARTFDVLPSTDFREIRQELERLENGATHAFRRGRISARI